MDRMQELAKLLLDHTVDLTTTDDRNIRRCKFKCDRSEAFADGDMPRQILEGWFAPTSRRSTVLNQRLPSLSFHISAFASAGWSTRCNKG
jgi:hypothetical protein